MRANMFELTEDDAKRRRAALATMLGMMDVPEMRKEPKPSNLRWLQRNLAVNNSNNPMLQSTLDLVKWLLRWENA